MSIRILMIGDNALHMAPDTEMLKDRGFAVYTCPEELALDMISEIKPAVIFINLENPAFASTKVYHEILDDVHFASIPVIYTLAEDDVYLVIKRRTASRDKRNLICDNIIDGIKIGLLGDTTINKKRINIPAASYVMPGYARA